MALSKLLALVTSLAVLGAAQTVAAQPAAQAGDPSTDARARQLFLEGRDAFSRGDFATAARAFDQAYQLSRRPQLLYNIGTTYERLHNWNEALIAFRRYVTEVPDAADRAEVEARIRVIEVEVEHQTTVRAQPEVTTRVVVVERPVIVAPDPPRPWRTAFWVAGGLTLLAGAGTLTVGLLADDRYNTLASNCARTPQGCDSDDIADMELRQTIVNTGIALTSVFAAATVLTFVLDLTRAQPRPVYHQVPTARAGFAPIAGGGLFTLEGSL